jgi:hypothetical protein
MAIMNIENKIVAFGDVAVTNNPRLRYVDWYRNVQGIPVNTPRSESFVVNPNKTVGIAGESITGSTNLIRIADYEAKGTRTSLMVDFDYSSNPQSNGQVTAIITELESITVLPTGFVKFKMPMSQTISGVAGGNIFYVKGFCTQDGMGPINQINEGLWKVLSSTETPSEKYFICQKLSNGYSAVNQSDIGVLGEAYNLVVSANLNAEQGDYFTFFVPGSQYGYLLPVLYADAYRIDVPALDFEVTVPADGYAVPEKYEFAYIEVDGEALASYEVGGTTFQVPIIPMQVAPDQKLGWAQITSGFNYIAITNNGSKPIRVTTVVGG